MQFEETNDDYNPLPVADLNREFQALSFLALGNALSAKDWIFRDERTDDAGVDASIEILLNSRHTNQRAQVQLKGTGSIKANKDGSLSLKVEVHNLLYLLNGQSPLYILYIVPQEKLRFAWARDEQKRLDRENPDWRSQKTVSLRIRTALTAQTLNEIRERILREARLQRDVHDILGRSAAGEHVRICFDPETLRHTNPQKQLELILEQGISLVNGGLPNEVVDAVQALNPEAVQQPRVQLVLGYAYFLQGQFAQALAALTLATISNSQLSEDDQQFLSHLRDTCDYHSGHLTFNQFIVRQSHWKADASHSYAVALRLAELRETLNSHIEVSSRRESVNLIQSEIQKLYEDDNLSTVLRHQALLFWLYAEGSQMVMEELEDLSRIKIRQRMNQPSHAPEVLATHFEKWRALYALSEQMRLTAVSLNHPLLLADFYFNRVSLGMMRMTTVPLISAIFSEEEEAESPDAVKILIKEAEEAIKIYQATGQFHGELHTKVLIAQVKLLSDDYEGACEIANEVLPIAQAMKYAAIELLARQTLEGTTALDNARIRSFDRAKIDEDFHIAAESDEFYKGVANDLLKTLRLPPERRQNLETSLFSTRAVAREHINWCRHLQLVEDMTHTHNPRTLHAQPPVYGGACTKLEIRGEVEHIEYKVAIEQFRFFVCEGCPHREPKQNSVLSSPR